MIRRPAATIVAPLATLSIAGSALLVNEVLGHFLLLFGLAASWVWMSYADEDPPERPLLRLILIAGSIATFGCSTRLVQLVSPHGFSPYLLDAAILFMLVAFPLFVPAWASGARGPVVALQRSRLLCRGHGVRIAASWMLLVAGYAALLGMLALGTMVVVSFPRLLYGIEFHILEYGPLVLVLILAGVWSVPVSMTMALSTVAHARLRRAQIAGGSERWVEVFR